MKKAMFILAALTLTGCIQMVRPQVTSIPFDSTVMELAPMVRGETQRFTLLGIFSGDLDNEFSTEVAIEKALKNTGGDIILNPTVDVETKTYFGLLTSQTIRVSGQSARFKNRPVSSKERSVGSAEEPKGTIKDRLDEGRNLSRNKW